ncbi:hypothetical protein JMJ35_003608 [Cladonia borealis]|uniref:Uncharacterized protein n=1 Tax=Cladonia borealis TaxID=184061 RepID=A0AA39R4G2_9LECA|nr:hypothetical protein JMJ35_003608 [Cladonia borealis]
MKFSSLATTAVVCAAAAVTALPQVEEPCTYTATSCATIGGPTETITVYEQPFTATATSTYDCEGCSVVTVETENCYGVGPAVTTTTFEYLNAQASTTVAVCSPTPN